MSFQDYFNKIKAGLKPKQQADTGLPPEAENVSIQQILAPSIPPYMVVNNFASDTEDTVNAEMETKMMMPGMETKTSRAWAATALSARTTNIGTIWTPIRYDMMAREYLNNIYVFSCIRNVSIAMGGIPWNVCKETEEGELDPINNHPLKDLIERPNPYQSWPEFIDNIVCDLMITGNCYIERAGVTGKPPEELYVLRPDRVSVIPGDQFNMIYGYIYRAAEVQIFYPRELICHIKLFNPLNDWYGMSPLQPALRSIESVNEIRLWNMQLVKNGARPPSALRAPSELDEEAYRRLKDVINEAYSGGRNAGKPIILEAGLDWQPLAFTPADMGWMENMRLSAKEIAMAIGVPPEIIGDSTNRSYANFQEARRAYYIETILPNMDRLKEHLNNWLSPLYSDEPYLDYDKDEIEAIQEDMAQKAATVVSEWQAGIITLNEARYELKREKRDDGDVTIGELQIRQAAAAMGGMPGGNANGGTWDNLLSGLDNLMDSGNNDQQQQPEEQNPMMAQPGQPQAQAPGQEQGQAGAPVQAQQPAGQSAQAAPGTLQIQQGQQPAQVAQPAQPEPKQITVKDILSELLKEPDGKPTIQYTNSGLPDGAREDKWASGFVEYSMVEYRHRKAAKDSQYFYPLDDTTLSTYMSDKKEVSTYFHGVFVSNMMQRIIPMLQSANFENQDDLHKELTAVTVAEAASRVFPTRKVYDKVVIPYVNVMDNGGKFVDGEEYKAKAWQTDDINDIFETMKTEISKLHDMFQSGKYNIYSPELYPVAAKALLFARALYHRVLTEQLGENGSDETDKDSDSETNEIETKAFNIMQTADLRNDLEAASKRLKDLDDRVKMAPVPGELKSVGISKQDLIKAYNPHEYIEVKAAQKPETK